MFLSCWAFRASDTPIIPEGGDSSRIKIRERILSILQNRFEEMSETELETEEQFKDMLNEVDKSIAAEFPIGNFSTVIVGDLDYFMNKIPIISLDKSAPIKNLNDLIYVVKKLPSSTCE